MSLFDDDELTPEGNAASTNLTLLGFNPAHYLVDVAEFRERARARELPPIDAILSDRAGLAQMPGMQWLGGVETILFAPGSPDLDAQRSQLNTLFHMLKAEAILLPQAFMPTLPEGYHEPLLAIDTETTGLDTRLRYGPDGKIITRTQIVGLPLATSDTRGYYLPVRHTTADGVPNWDPQVITEFLDQLAQNFTIILHNANYDREVLVLNGVTKLRPFPYFFDTQILDYLFDVNVKVHGLKACSERHLGRKMIEIGQLFNSKEHIEFEKLSATAAHIYGACVTGETELDVVICPCNGQHQHITQWHPHFSPESTTHFSSTALPQTSLFTGMLARLSLFNAAVANTLRSGGTTSKQATRVHNAGTVPRNSNTNVDWRVNKIAFSRTFESVALTLAHSIKKVLTSALPAPSLLYASAATPPRFSGLTRSNQSAESSVLNAVVSTDWSSPLKALHTIFGDTTSLRKNVLSDNSAFEKVLGLPTGNARFSLLQMAAVQSRGSVDTSSSITSTTGHTTPNSESFSPTASSSLEPFTTNSTLDTAKDTIRMPSLPSSTTTTLDETGPRQMLPSPSQRITVSQLRRILQTEEVSVSVKSPDGYVPVIALLDQGVKSCLTFNNRLTCSLDQRLQRYTAAGFEWVPAEHIRQGDLLLTEQGLQTINTITTSSAQEVYDLSVDHPEHRYYADGFSVHNCDAINTYALFKFYASQPAEQNVFTQQSVPVEVDHKMIDVARDMTRPGLPINLRYFYYAGKDAIYRLQQIEQAIYQEAGRQFDIGSPKQLGEVLFEDFKIPPLPTMEKGANGVYSTKEEVLDELFEAYPDFTILRYVVTFRKLQATIGKIYLKSLANSYVDSYLPWTRVQLSFSQTNVPTGRLSSSSGDGKERVTVAETKKTKKLTYSYTRGSWDCGFNSQGVPNPHFKTAPARKVTKLPPEAGLNLDAPYPDEVHAQFIKGLAAL